MNAPPLLFGGKSPVVAYFKHSIIVLNIYLYIYIYNFFFFKRTHNIYSKYFSKNK